MPTLSIPLTLAATEGSPLAVPITKDGEGACSVTIRTRAGTASRDADYAGIEQVEAFGEHEAVRTVSVRIAADAAADLGETFLVLLEGPAGCTLGNARCEVTVAEPLPVPRVDMGPDVFVREGGTATFTLAKTGRGACSVSVRTRGITAVAGKDYAPIDPTPVTFAEDEATRTFGVPVAADAAAEGGETFALRIDPGSERGCSVGRASATATIRDAAPPAPAPIPTDPAGPTDPPPVDPVPDPIPDPIPDPVPDEPADPDEEEPMPEPPQPSRPFPAPRGFGNARAGGVGRPVYRVTSLADDGKPGTLRHALETAGTGGRMVVFEVGGVIKVTSRLNVFRAHNVTVAGETAPPPGIVLQASGKFNGPIMVLFDARNFHFSNIAFEQVDHNWRVNDTNYDCFGTEPRKGEKCEDVWIDHCATFWSQDEAVSIYHGRDFDPRTSALRNISITNTMFCEPLWKSEQVGSQPHWEGGKVDEPEHNFNLLLGYRVRNCDVQYCLFQDATWRNPWIDVGTTAVLANNLSNNCQHAATVQMNNKEGNTLLTVAGYLVITGPNTHNTALSGLRIHNVTGGGGHRFYSEGLHGWKGVGAKVAPTDRVFLRNEGTMRPLLAARRPIDCPTPVKALSAQQIYDRAVRNVGPRPKERKIPSVAKAVDKLRRKTGRYVHLPRDSGGPSVLPATRRPLGPEGASASPGKFPDGTPIPPLPRSGDAAAMGRWLRRMKDSVQLD